jgi:hypothetical protein
MAKQRPEEKGRAWAELNLLNAAGVFPTTFEGTRIGAATPIYDLNGEELFVRLPLAKGRRGIGYADVATHPALGALLLGVSDGMPWNERAIRQEGLEAAGTRLQRRADTVRFVAYSYPKVALQLLADGKELAMLELWSWLPVPERLDRSPDEPPSNFERWSFLEEQPRAALRRNRTRYRKRIAGLQELLAKARSPTADQISRAEFERLVGRDITSFLVDSRELHLSSRNTDHATCYEVRGQQTGVWCVAASVEMLLDFYRYEYTQVRVAAELGLGTLSSPSGLPYARDGDVVTVIENLTSKGLDANMNMSPSWAEFRNEVRANRPLISFIPGHSRAVAGYLRSGLGAFGLSPFRGLLVYDPWPPNVGVVTRWENFDAATYRRTFAAHITLV